MKQFIKRFLYRVAPRLATALVSARSRAHTHRLLIQWGCNDVNRALHDQFGNAVLEGPFAGMTLTVMTQKEQWGPYLLGVYESELDEAWKIILAGEYRQILDVGAKFGYYAVGLARRFPSIPVVAFDTDWWARRAIREMARENRTQRLEVRSFCDAKWLAERFQSPAFVISDCEGFESQLFSKSVFELMRQSVVLIEAHDCLVPGVSQMLMDNSRQTHQVRVFESGVGIRPTTRSLDFLAIEKRFLATHEARSEQRWLLCLPKEGPNEDLSTMTMGRGAP